MSILNSLATENGLPPLFDPSTAPFLDTDQRQIARAHSIQYTDAEVFNSDTHLTGAFKTGPVAHKVTGGFDYMRYQETISTSGVVIDNVIPGVQPPFDIYNPQYGMPTFQYSLQTGTFLPRDQIPVFARPEETQTQAGLYIQDQLRLGPWLAVLGLRQDWLTMEQAGAPDETETATTGRAALMYEFDFGLSPYVSYSTSFSPLPGQPVGSSIISTTIGETLRPAGPLEGEQVEVGFKYQPRGAPFMINAAIYELSERNQIAQPDFLFDSVQGADVRVRGFEIEAIGKLTPELKVIGAYSYTDAEYEKYPELYPYPSGISEFIEGKPLDGIPRHLASLWAIYSVLDGPLRGLSFGGGVRYVGPSESHGKEIQFGPGNIPIYGPDIYVKTPSFTLFDAMLAYETDEWRWHITGQNLEDKYHFTSCTAYRGDCGVGQARTIITGFTYKF